MKYLRYSITMKEHPEHISLCFEISGCPHACAWCHSPELQSNNGYDLYPSDFLNILRKYAGLADCVIFFGGDHEVDELVTLLKLAKSWKLKTCLWTGNNYIDDRLHNHLDYVKIGPYVESLGPIGSKTTNQRYFNIETGQAIVIK